MARISFEFFPPKSDEGRRSLGACATKLAAFDPAFVSVTYGAGGSSRDRSIEALTHLLETIDVPVAAHLTTMGATAGELQETIDVIADLGIRHLVALRGDQPADEQLTQAYESATDLVAAIRARPDGSRFEISVAAYPETHPRAASSQADLDNLRAKLDAGADRAITQFFFDPDLFLSFADRAVAAGIDKPIVPGIMPIASFKNVSRFARMCGASVPDWLASMLADLDDDPELQQPVAANIVTEQCRRLLDAGVEQFHFYTLNRRQLAAAVCHSLQLRGPAAPDPSIDITDNLATTGSPL